MHTLGFHYREIEATGKLFSEVAFQKARERSWETLREIRASLHYGLNEPQAIEIAYDVLKRMGSARSWHRPIVRFGANARLTFRKKPDPQALWREGDAVMIDIGPVWRFGKVEYEGDVGDTFAPEGTPAAKIASAARELFTLARDQWRNGNLSGESIYAYIKNESRSRGYELVEPTQGHRIGDFPHQRFSRQSLGELPFTPAPGVWMLEVQLEDPSRQFGAFYEDVLSQS